MLRMSRTAKVLLTLFAFFVFACMYAPLLTVVLNSFSADRISRWPVQEFSLKWWEAAFTNEAAQKAVLNSAVVGLAATLIALVLGTMVAFALQRYRFFGRNTVNLLVVLPIALPGIVTGVALNNSFNNVLEPAGIHIGYFGMIVAHATFCIVMVFNNVFARLNRMNPRLEEAAADLGASPMQTFRLVTFPQFRSAFIAGGLLAFALSFDEIVVTIFTAPPGVDTVPLWMMNAMARPNEANMVNAVATVLILFSLVPVWLSQRLSRDEIPS